MSKQNVSLIILFLTLRMVVCAQPYGFNVISNKNKQNKGYYFLCTYKMRKDTNNKISQQMIMDETGHTLYYRLSDFSSNNKASDFKVHKDGTMSYFGKNKTYILNKEFQLIDLISALNGVEMDSHDFLVLPNGNYLILGFESIDFDFSSYPIFMQQNIKGSKKGKLKYNVIQEIDKNRKLVYQWSAEKYFNLNDAEKMYLNDTVMVDITHFNSIDFNTSGDFLISARYHNEIFKVNRKTGNIVWRLGGKKNQFKFLNDTIPFLGQHDARFIKNGNITLFDNGYGTIKHNARALEYKLDELNKTCKLVWSYENKETIISEATGNVQRLKNGNTLINYGKVANGTPNIAFEEVNKKGDVIFKVMFNDTIGSYRTFHYQKLPFKLTRPKIISFQKNGEVYLKTEKKYSSYLWSNGETSEEIKVKKNDLYFVYVPSGNGGFISSKKIIIKQKDLK